MPWDRTPASGKSQYLVAEADESDRSFLKLSPILSVVTNIDREHMDTYRNMRDVKKTFLDFMDRVPFYGMIVACNDDPLLRRLLPEVQRRTVTYGTRRGSDFLIKIPTPRAKDTREMGHPPRNIFEVTYNKQDLGEFTLHVPGVHNILNATAAIAVGVGLDISTDSIRAALDQFRGVDRRFQFKGQAARRQRDRRLWPPSDRDQGHARRRPPMRIPQDSRHLPAPPLHPDSRSDGRIRHRFQ